MQNTVKIGSELKNSSPLKALFHAGFHAFALVIYPVKERIRSQRDRIVKLIEKKCQNNAKHGKNRVRI